MSFGDTRKKVLEHLSLNTDGFWTNVPLQLKSEKNILYFRNANELAKKMQLMERDVVEALAYKKPLVGFNEIAIDQRFWKTVAPITALTTRKSSQQRLYDLTDHNLR